MFSTVISAIITIVVVTVVLVALLLYVKIKLTPDGTVKIDINDGKKVLDVPQGSDLLHTLADRRFSFLPLAVERRTAVSARFRCLKAAEPSFLPRPASSAASRSRTATGSVAR